MCPRVRSGREHQGRTFEPIGGATSAAQLYASFESGSMGPAGQHQRNPNHADEERAEDEGGDHDANARISGDVFPTNENPMNVCFAENRPVAGIPHP